MKAHTMNMFADTCEDLPIISGISHTEVVEERPDYTDDGMDGYYRGCSIAISPTTNNEYRIQIERGSHGFRLGYEATLEQAHAWAKTTCEELS